MGLEEFTECNGATACDNINDSIDADVNERYAYWIILGALFMMFQLLALAMYFDSQD